MTLAKLGKYAEAVPVRQIEVKQDEIDVGMLFDELHRLATVRRFENGGVALQFHQSPAHGFAQERVIVTRRIFIAGSPRPAASPSF
jgi:hypothetical protein